MRIRGVFLIRKSCDAKAIRDNALPFQYLRLKQRYPLFPRLTMTHYNNITIGTRIQVNTSYLNIKIYNTFIFYFVVLPILQ